MELPITDSPRSGQPLYKHVFPIEFTVELAYFQPTRYIQTTSKLQITDKKVPPNDYKLYKTASKSG